MSRNTTTGVYTRVDNTFSNPVVGTTISPTDADTFFDDIEAAANSFLGTSTTSLAIGLGAKTFTTQTSKTFLPGLFVQARSQANPTVNYMYGSVTSYDGVTGSLVLNVLQVGGSGTLADWSLFTAGARGGAGPVSGIRQLYSSTTTDADPGAGTFRLNNATIASATAAYLDNVDTAGSSVTTRIDKWDDSTTTTKGYVVFEKEDDHDVWAEFTLTGSVVDGTGYRKLTLSAGSSSGVFTAGDAFRISFRTTGDKGADGSGNVSASPSFVADNRLTKTDRPTSDNTSIQITGIAVDDSNNVSAVANLAITGSLDLGNSDTTLSRASAGVMAVEGVNLTPNIPITSKSTAYTTVLADANTAIYHPSSDNNARTFTIDSNANVAYPVGTCLMFINEINTVTISITSDTLTAAGSGSTGSRTLAANGIANAIKVASTKWVISGTGLT